MQSKTLLILANSIKNCERCIAGREVVWNDHGYTFGPWVRPISDHGEGELSREEIQRDDRTEVAVLDFADVRLARHAGDPCHPEDWFVHGQRPWSRPVRYCKNPPPSALEERPRDLWLEPGSKSDRASHAFVTAQSPAFSICVVAATNLRLVCMAEFNPAELRTVRKYRAQFAYNGAEYDLSLTDPAATERYFRGQSANEKIRTVGLDASLICVSLTPEFRKTGYHYKVVATILGK